MNLHQVIQDFKTNIIDFLNELIEQFDTEPDLILARLFLENAVDPEKIITVFIQECMPYRDAVANRDESLFLDGHLSLFSAFDKTKVNHFKILWKSSALDEDDRQVIWQWFDVFFKLAERYQKLKISKVAE